MNWRLYMKKKILLLLVVFIVGFISFKVVVAKDTLNVLVYGLEGTRSDSMMLIMMDESNNQVNVITIPRDTYNPVEGHDGQGAKKLNAVYGFKNDGGTSGLIKSIESIVGVDIDRFIEVKYDGVKAITDLVGGVPVDVPYDMDYDDTFSSPPLHIHIKQGEQVLEGDQVIEYLRFRKSNDGTISEGDIQRIDRQQDFLMAAAGKVLTWKLPFVVMQALSNVETDITSLDIGNFGFGMVGAKQENIFFHVLPQEKIGRGEDGLSYVFYSPEQTAQLIEDIKNDVFTIQEDEETESK